MMNKEMCNINYNNQYDNFQLQTTVTLMLEKCDWFHRWNN